MTLRQTAFVALGIAVASFALGQAAKAKPKAPPAKAAAVQMPGDNGKFDVPYRLGSKNEELVFTLEKAEFASRFVTTDGMGCPDADKRLLVLTYAVQNPGDRDRFFFNQSFSFTVVSPDDENFECDGLKSNGWLAYHPDRRDQLSMQLKPAQKVRALVAIEMHMKGPVNKLIVQRGKGNPVLRYDLKEKVAPMAGAFASNGGLDMIPVGSALLTQTADLGPWDLTVEKMADELLPIGSYAPDKGQKFVVLTVSVKNASLSPYPLHSSLIQAKATDADGAALPVSTLWVKNSSPDPFVNMTVEPGASVRFRILFPTGLLSKLDKATFKDPQYSERSVVVKLEEPKKDPPK